MPADLIIEEIHKNSDQKAPSGLNQALSTPYAKEWAEVFRTEMQLRIGQLAEAIPDSRVQFTSIQLHEKKPDLRHILQVMGHYDSISYPNARPTASYTFQY